MLHITHTITVSNDLSHVLVTEAKWWGTTDITTLVTHLNSISERELIRVTKRPQAIIKT